LPGFLGLHFNHYKSKSLLNIAISPIQIFIDDIQGFIEKIRLTQLTAGHSIDLNL
jgi:hypothetical protein